MSKKKNTWKPGMIYDQYYIYFLYNLNEIVYIGFAHDVNKRLKDHKKLGKIFDSHKFFPVQYYSNNGLYIERELIKMLKPILNGDVLCGRKERKNKSKITKFKEKELV